MPTANEIVALAFAMLTYVPLSDISNPIDRPFVLSTEKHEVGSASLHWKRGRVACNRLRWDNRKLVAAHRSLPCGTKVTVVNVDRGYAEVSVTIVDRGPFKPGRIIDLSPAAGAKIGLTRRQGIAQNVRIAW